jgi:hypothetical protein
MRWGVGGLGLSASRVGEIGKTNKQRQNEKLARAVVVTTPLCVDFGPPNDSHFTSMT